MANNSVNWRPTCSKEMLQIRSFVLNSVRQFFRKRSYCEVETPLLSSDIVVDAFLDPMEVHNDSDDRRLFLQTSPEAGMKRLLAAGSGSIFQVTRSFRGREVGSRHNPEFTMVEWYGVDSKWSDQVQLTEDLLRHVWSAASEYLAATESTTFRCKELSKEAFRLTDYATAFQRRLHVSVFDLSVAELQSLAVRDSSLGENAFRIHDKDNLLNVLLAECIEPNLGTGTPEYLHNYPLSQAALAEQNPEDERTALRFELYWDGMELCNGYQELTDPAELTRRDVQQNSVRSKNDSQPLPGAQKMLAAMQSGLPKCSGVALGFDRLLMSILGLREIRDVLCFPFDSA